MSGVTTSIDDTTLPSAWGRPTGSDGSYCVVTRRKPVLLAPPERGMAIKQSAEPLTFGTHALKDHLKIAFATHCPSARDDRRAYAGED